ncbi:MAG: hypothetical protein QW097_00460 [archaeon]
MRGQAFTIFEMMLAGIFAIALAAIIFAYISSTPKPFETGALLKEMVGEAYSVRVVSQCISRDFELKKGETISSKSIQHFFPDISIRVINNCGSKVECSDSGSLCTAKYNMKIPISTKCDSSKCAIYLCSNSCS